LTAACQHRVAFYGSLLRRFPTQTRLGVAEGLEFLGPCRLRGRLLDLGPYPGLVDGGRLVRGELYRLADPAVLKVLDRFEAYDPADPAGSEYLRQCETLAEPRVTAWVYRLRLAPAGAPEVAGGDWAEHLAAAGRTGRFEEFLRGRTS
jgi:gamma-glutamylcyclotransferase (GGCT)/AIG2-like uncharacterized protein YtfP